MDRVTSFNFFDLVSTAKHKKLIYFFLLLIFARHNATNTKLYMHICGEKSEMDTPHGKEEGERAFETNNSRCGRPGPRANGRTVEQQKVGGQRKSCGSESLITFTCSIVAAVIIVIGHGCCANRMAWR